MASRHMDDNAKPSETELRHLFVQLNLASMKRDQNEATLEGLKAVFEKAKDMQYSSILVNCGMVISLNYSNQRDWSASVHWAKEALKQAEEMGDHAAASDAAKAVAINLRDAIKDSKTPNLKDVEELAAFLQTWATKDGSLGFVDNQIDKYGILSNVETLVPKLFPNSDVHDAAKRSLKWLDMAGELVSQLPEDERLVASAEIQFKVSDAYYILDDFPMAIRCLEIAHGMFMAAGRDREAGHAQKKMALIQLLSVEQGLPDGSINPEASEAQLNKSLEHLQQLESSLVNSGFKFQLVQCHLAQAWIWERAFRMGQPGALQEALRELEVAENIQNNIRSDMTIQKNEDVLKHKSTMVAQTAQLYELGVKLHLADQNISGAWQWVQKGKARAFYDLMSFGGTVPHDILDNIDGHVEAEELLKKESELLQLCEHAALEQRFPLRQQISAIRSKMSQCNELEDLLLFRGTKTINTSHLEPMLANRKDVVCVDWTVVQGRIWIFIIRGGEQPFASELDLSPEEISLWIESNLKAEYMRQPRANERMRSLDPLIAPLADKTKPGEHLIFCPGGLLSQLPLHALELPGALLLERNPVSYVSSLSILYHCILRRSGEPSSLANATIFGNPTCDRSAAETSSIDLAKRIGVEPYIGQQATKRAFKTTAAKSNLFHYHGHAAFARTDPLLSALIMNQGGTELSTGEALTAREILGLCLNIALFVMIACESAQQEINAGEEPTGLLAMLMLAGVNSVIGTLWKCSDAAGKQFTKEFYDALLRQLDADVNSSGTAIWLNLAGAVQQAALEIRKSRPAPYFWALFVLHGDWQCLMRKDKVYGDSANVDI